VEDKQRPVDAHGLDEDCVQLTRQMEIKRTTAYAIIRRAQENGCEVARTRGDAVSVSVSVSDIYILTKTMLFVLHRKK